MICNLCPNECNVARSVSRGACLAPDVMLVNRIAPHYYEEPPISGTKGSGTIFFSGCTMRCDFCQNTAISRNPNGIPYTPYELQLEIKKLEERGVHNINFVTPTHYAHKIKETLDIYRPSIPIVYNTSGYEKREVIEEMHDYVDVYLPDFKYMDRTLAKRLSHREDYPEKALLAIESMLKAKENVYDDNGIMRSGVIIRHLVLPYHVDNSIKVLDTIYREFGNGVTMSLMSQFTPMQGCKELDRAVLPLEYKMVVKHAESLGFTDVFIQETSSASSEFIPEWQFNSNNVD